MIVGISKLAIMFEMSAKNYSIIKKMKFVLLLQNGK